ncbi:MAG: peptide-methionine (S)-S-oxide reductase MsrA [Verrucomicrobiota bacterium]
MDKTPAVAPQPAPHQEVTTLGAGCFWCVEAVYERIEGVLHVTSGYMGGQNANPTYEQICTGTTGHAEVVQLIYDPEIVSFETILEKFFQLHDPTQLNRQGNDVGTQYRSAIFTHHPEQAVVAEAVQAKAAAWWDRPIVTEITPASTFYPAETYHQDFWKNNPANPYCAFSIPPKLEKLGLH